MRNIFIYTFRCLNILRAYSRVELNPLLKITMILSLIFCSRWLKRNSVNQVVVSTYCISVILFD